MFTLEESALLGRMLRVMGWALVCVALATVGCVAFLYVERPHTVVSHPAGVRPAHGHHSRTNPSNPSNPANPANLTNPFCTARTS